MASATPPLPSPGHMVRSTTSPARTAHVHFTESSSLASRPPPFRSISFNVQMRDVSEGHRVRWDSEAEERLQAAERELDRAQRSWSERQEIWVEEVEKLRGLKSESERFYRRREKLMRAEGYKWWKTVARNKEIGMSGSTLTEEPEEWNEEDEDAEDGSDTLSPGPSPRGKGFGMALLLQRIANTGGHNTPNTDSQSSSRKSSFVGNLMKGGIFRRRRSV